MKIIESWGWQILFALFLLIVLSGVSAQNTDTSSFGPKRVERQSTTPAEPPRSVQWESLGFSADGRFFASITYGVEYNLEKAESNFFARLSVLHLLGKNSELALEQTLRRSGPLQKGLTARSIMQDLLRRESRRLRSFQIKAMEQGKILLSPEELETAEADKEEAAEEPSALSEKQPGMSMRPNILVLQELTSIERDTPENILDRVYTVGGSVFQLERLRLDSLNSLRGQILVRQFQGFPRRYSFQQNWNTLLQRQQSEHELRPVFIALSPNGLHLLLTVRIFEAQKNFARAEESNDSPALKLENNNNYAFETFSVQVY